jgi:hypothetical protein
MYQLCLFIPVADRATVCISGDGLVISVAGRAMYSCRLFSWRT